MSASYDLLPRADIDKLYPNGLKLEQVQIFLRHGERSPIRPLFQNGGLNFGWSFCNSAHRLSTVVMTGPGKWDSMTWRRRLETIGHDDHPDAESHATYGICEPGELTDKGRQTTLDFGKRLRDLYVDQLGFLPRVLSDPDMIYVRTSAIRRALESAQQALIGLYPPNALTRGIHPPSIHVRSSEDETLYPNGRACPRFHEIRRAFIERTAARWNHSDEMKYINDKVGKWMPDDTKIAVDSSPRLAAVMDNVKATIAHHPHAVLPLDFYDPKVRQFGDAIAVEEWFQGFKESNEYRMLGIGSLAGDVVSRMVGWAEKDKGISIQKAANLSKFALFGCHDSTIASMLTSLGCFNSETWPPFTSYIAFELFRSDEHSTPISRFTLCDSPSGDGTLSQAIGRRPLKELTDAERSRLDGYYVRVKYNDRVMKLPACAARGKHLQGDDGFCTLAAFKSIVDQYTPRNRRKACVANRGAPPIPAIQEPPGRVPD